MQTVRGNRKINVRSLVVTAVLGAVAAVLMQIEVPIPALIPSFVKLDISELPALIAAFSLGPVSGIVVCLIKNVFSLFTTSTGGVGELCNFLLGVSFVLPAGLIYKTGKTKKSAIIGSVIGAAIMALMSLPINYFITYPMYTTLYFGGNIEAILDMYRAILPGTDSLWKALLIFNMPFTLCKGLIDALITAIIYKKISPVIKGSNI